MKMIGKLILAAIIAGSPAIIVSILAMIGFYNFWSLFAVYNVNMLIVLIGAALPMEQRWKKKVFDFINS